VFLDGAAGARVREIAEQGPARVGWDGIGTVTADPEAIERHLDLVLELPWIDQQSIRRRRPHVALDCVRGAGGVAIPPLLERLGCRVTAIHVEPDGRFPHEPEPVPQNLRELGDLVRSSKADMGMAVDPDVDRLALVDETGRAIGEDYTLAFAVRAVLGTLDGQKTEHEPVVVANLSTSLVVEDAAKAYGARFVRAPVGEANVAAAMKAENALIGGEGNGGVILPSLHIGRDAPLGVALVLQYFTSHNISVSSLVGAAPAYRIVKAKAPRGADLPASYERIRRQFPEAIADERDGLRLAWSDRWVHVRPSGTEPIIRLIAEAPTDADAERLISVCRDLLA
jgi:phosphomannomutase